ncbi:hypothetical protein Agub_g13853, partial [Astrephomene gubernaculifera]
PLPAMLMVRAARALSGWPQPASTLRYKKKMMLWSFPEPHAPPPPPPPPPAAAPPSSGQQQQQQQQVVPCNGTSGAGTTTPSSAAGGASSGSTSSTSSGSSTSAAGGGVVGYSLMTFVIRNGLGALRQGETTYAAYVDNLARRSWGLP